MTDEQAGIIAATIQALLYGLYLATLAHCLRWLLFDDDGWSHRNAKDINWRMLIITVVIFLFSTASLFLGLTLPADPTTLVSARNPPEE